MARLEDRFERTLSVSGPVKLVVHTGSGDVHIRRGAEGRVSVQGRVFIMAFSRQHAHELAEKIKSDPPIAVVSDTIKIGDLSKYRESAGWFLVPSISIDFDIQVPYETEVELGSGSGDQTVSGIRGPVRAQAGSGDIEITNVEREVSVSIGSGDITVSGAAQVTASAGSGDIKLSTITGDVQAQAGSGDISLSHVNGNATMSTRSGDIRVDSHIGPTAQWRLEASSGDIFVRVPADARFALDARTSSGDIEVDFPLTVMGKLSKRALHGTVGESPGAQISIRTSSGDIYIQKG